MVGTNIWHTNDENCNKASDYSQYVAMWEIAQFAGLIIALFCIPFAKST